VGDVNRGETFPGGPGGGHPADSGPKQIEIPPETVNRVYQQRARHVRDALQRAFKLLDAGQLATARRLLTEHGVNLDTGELGGNPGAQPLDPKLGEPLPREP
jgi:hypothetical protein